MRSNNSSRSFCAGSLSLGEIHRVLCFFFVQRSQYQRDVNQLRVTLERMQRQVEALYNETGKSLQ